MASGTRRVQDSFCFLPPLFSWPRVAGCAPFPWLESTPPQAPPFSDPPPASGARGLGRSEGGAVGDAARSGGRSWDINSSDPPGPRPAGVSGEGSKVQLGTQEADVRKGVLERAPSAPQTAGRLRRAGRTSPSPVCGQVPSSGADPLGPVPNRHRSCESHFLGLLGPSPGVSGGEVGRILQVLRTLRRPRPEFTGPGAARAEGVG